MAQLVMVTGEQDSAGVRGHAAELCAHLGTQPQKARYFKARLGELSFVWEQHTELGTYSFIRRSDFTDPFAAPVLADLPAGWLASMPGQVLRATQVSMLARVTLQPTPAELRSWFSFDGLVCCDVHGGEARIWSDFRLGEDGFGRLLIQDRELASGSDCARLEERLAALTRQIAENAAEEHSLLHELSALSAELAGLQADTRYRMSATRAYAQLVRDRLRSLGVVRVPGFQTLIDFTERRLTPAVRTCESFSLRAEDLAQRAQLGELAPAHTYRNHPRAPEHGAARVDEPPGEAAAASAANARGSVHARDQLLLDRASDTSRSR